MCFTGGLPGVPKEDEPFKWQEKYSFHKGERERESKEENTRTNAENNAKQEEGRGFSLSTERADKSQKLTQVESARK